MFHEIETVVLTFIEFAALIIEILAVFIIFIAVLGGMVQYLQHAFVSHTMVDQRFQTYKLTLGRSLLLGLEILVAADIIKTVALETTFQSVATLGILVLIRIFLGWSLIVEMDGRWPWQGGKAAEDAESGDLSD